MQLPKRLTLEMAERIIADAVMVNFPFSILHSPFRLHLQRLRRQRPDPGRTLGPSPCLPLCPQQD